MEVSAAKLCLAWHDDRVLELDWQLALPDVAGTLNGKTPAQVRDALGLLYRLCGQAQLRAAVSLQEGALGVVPSADTEATRDQAIWLEWMREHGWQLFRAASLCLTQSPALMQALVAWQRAMQQAQAQLPADLWRPGVSVQPLQGIDLAPMLAAFCRGIYQPIMAALEQRGWAGLAITPTAQVQALESGSAARTQLDEASLAGRFEALRAEMTQALHGFVHPQRQSLLLAPGQVDAARGQLRHQCDWSSGVAANYQIEIPTPALLTSLRRTLSHHSFQTRSVAEAVVPLLVLAHAPCLDVAVEWRSRVAYGGADA
ncbi:hypothetical protein [Ferrimonas pelagia]|uniref:Uncharacterized protein n=1 Tax=Ferrimonas pelagia TaxID=1177826 RepID=A0ABP9EF09_9GAMM